MEDNRMVSFSLGGMAFEYDDNKNQINIKKHGISFKSAARIFFDYDRIEFYDEDHSDDEDRYNTIGDTSAGRISQKAEGALIGNVDQFIGKVNEILFVVYSGEIAMRQVVLELRKVLPGFMVPRKVKQVSALPKLASGKIDMTTLKEEM